MFPSAIYTNKTKSLRNSVWKRDTSYKA